MELGYANPDDMMDAMPARVFEEWKQYLRVKAWEAEQRAKKR